MTKYNHTETNRPVATKGVVGQDTNLDSCSVKTMTKYANAETNPAVTIKGAITQESNLTQAQQNKVKKYVNTETNPTVTTKGVIRKDIKLTLTLVRDQPMTLMFCLLTFNSTKISGKEKGKGISFKN